MILNFIKYTILVSLVFNNICTVYAEPNVPKVFRSDIIYDTNIICLNSMTIAINRDIIISITINDKIGEAFSSVLLRSSDDGKTWEKCLTIRDEQGKRNTFATLHRLPDGNWNFGDLILGITELEINNPKNLNEFSYYYRISQDNGYTFGESLKVGEINSHGFPQSKLIELSSGKLFWPWQNILGQTRNGFAISIDNGKSWNDFVDPWGCSKYEYENISAAVCKNNLILAVANRCDDSNSIWLVNSADQGAKWSDPYRINVDGYEPSLFALPNNKIWLACRDEYKKVRLYQSENGGLAWEPLLDMEMPEIKAAQYQANADIISLGAAHFAELSDGNVYAVFIVSRKENGKFCRFLMGNVISIN